LHEGLGFLETEVQFNQLFSILQIFNLKNSNIDED